MDAIFVAGLPVGQPRVKATRFGAHARVYTPSTADKWKAQVALADAYAVEAAVPLVAGYAQVLHAVYRSDLAGAMQAAVDAARAAAREISFSACARNWRPSPA